ncbi:MAG: hypothetical protein II302_03155, partial [Clostridia bacterium]|nr:hypothetical protein [Clostridia bacterium]
MYPDYNNGQQAFNYQSSLNQPVNYNNGFVPYQDPVKLEKKNIRSYGNRLGGAMLLTLVGVNIIGVIFIMAATIIGKQALVDSPIFDLVFQFIFSILMFVPAFAIVAKLSKFRIGDLFVHKSIPASHTFWFVCMGLMVGDKVATFGLIITDSMNLVEFTEKYAKRIGVAAAIST